MFFNCFTQRGVSQELRVATLVPWSDVVPDEIQNTDLIAQAGGVDGAMGDFVWVGTMGTGSIMRCLMGIHGIFSSKKSYIILR